MHTTSIIDECTYKLVSKPTNKGAQITVYSRGKRIDRFSVELTPLEFHTQLRKEFEYIKRASSRLEQNNGKKEKTTSPRKKTERLPEVPKQTRSRNNRKSERRKGNRNTSK